MRKQSRNFEERLTQENFYAKVKDPRERRQLERERLKNQLIQFCILKKAQA